jgi:hypothetical protein
MLRGGLEEKVVDIRGIIEADMRRGCCQRQRICMNATFKGRGNAAHAINVTNSCLTPPFDLTIITDDSVLLANPKIDHRAFLLFGSFLFLELLLLIKMKNLLLGMGGWALLCTIFQADLDLSASIIFGSCERRILFQSNIKFVSCL